MRGFIFSLLLSLLALLFALYLQIFQGLDPCPLCILQRIAFISTGLISLIACLHRPKTLGRQIYVILGLVSAAFGFGFAMRQVFLQHSPESEGGTCGPSLDYMVHNLPLQKILTTLLQGRGDCSLITWQFMHLSLAAWSAVSFMIMMGLLCWQGILNRRSA